MTGLTADQLAVLRATVDEFEGCVIGSPRQVAQDGRDVAVDWRERGWPVTGLELVTLLNRSTTELAQANLLACHTPPGPGQPEWLAVSDLTVPARSDHKLPATVSTDPGLVDKLAATAHWLAGETDAWSGAVEDFRVTWKTIPGPQRPTGPAAPWPHNAEQLCGALAVAGPELASRGIEVQSDRRTVRIRLTSSYGRHGGRL